MPAGTHLTLIASAPTGPEVAWLEAGEEEMGAVWSGLGHITSRSTIGRIWRVRDSVGRPHFSHSPTEEG